MGVNYSYYSKLPFFLGQFLVNEMYLFRQWIFDRRVVFNAKLEAVTASLSLGLGSHHRHTVSPTPLQTDSLGNPFASCFHIPL